MAEDTSSGPEQTREWDPDSTRALGGLFTGDINAIGLDDASLHSSLIQFRAGRCLDTIELTELPPSKFPL